MGFLHLAAILVLTSSAAWAGSRTPQSIPGYVPTAESACSTVDLRAGAAGDRTGSMSDQKYYGWCYAYSAADIVSQALGVPVSAIDIAITYSHQVDHNFIDREWRRLLADQGELSKYPMYHGTREEYVPYQGGDPYLAIGALGTYGVCPEAAMTPLNQRSRWSMWEDIFDLHSIRKRIDKIGPDDLQQKGFPVLDIFPQISRAQVLEYLRGATDESYADVLFDLAKKNCEGKRIFPRDALKPVRRYYANGVKDRIEKGFLREINGLLNRKKMVSLTVQGTDYVLTRIDRSLTTTFLRDGLGNHVVTLFGRELKDGKCVYKIKDSAFGVCPGRFVDGVQCDEKSMTLTIPEQVLLRMSRGLLYLK